MACQFACLPPTDIAGHLSRSRNGDKRGLEKPKDTGIVNFFSAVAKCAQQTPAASVVHAPAGHGIQPTQPLPT